MKIPFLVFFGTFCWTGDGFASSVDIHQNNPGSTEPVEASSNIKSKKDDDENVIKLIRTDEAVEARTFSESEKRRVCGKYNGKYISVFGDVFKVDRCIRRPITDQELLFRLQKQGVRFIEVESTEVAAIPVGDTLHSTTSITKRGCKELNNTYITQSYMDIYWVEQCKKRLIPDYETFVELKRSKGHNKSMEVLALTPEEFESLQTGKEFDSVVDKKENLTKPEKRGVDIISIDEACRGVEGKVVSFYSRLYRIEKCRKREYDPEEFSKQLLRSSAKITELTAEQWVSIPDGIPMKRP